MEERIRKVMAAVFGMPSESVGVDASPDTIEAWDSVRHMSLILALEEEFGVRFDEQQMSELLNFELIAITLRELTGVA